MHKTETVINIQLSNAQIRQLKERGYTFLILPDTGEIKKITQDDLVPVEPDPPDEQFLSDVDKLLQECRAQLNKILQESQED